MKKIAFMLMVVGTATVQHSEAAKIYTCTVNGNTIYTTKYSGNCSTADLPSIGRYSSARYDAPQPARTAPRSTAVKRTNTATSASAVSNMVSNAAGNSGRRAILEQELVNERQALASARQSLASAREAKDGVINQQLVSELQGSVLDRQQNIQALQRELGRM